MDFWTLHDCYVYYLTDILPIIDSVLRIDSRLKPAAARIS